MRPITSRPRIMAKAMQAKTRRLPFSQAKGLARERPNTSPAAKPHRLRANSGAAWFKVGRVGICRVRGIQGLSAVAEYAQPGPHHEQRPEGEQDRRLDRQATPEGDGLSAEAVHE